MSAIPVKYIRTDVKYDWKSPYGLVMSWQSDNGTRNAVNISGAGRMKLDQLEKVIKFYLEDL